MLTNDKRTDIHALPTDALREFEQACITVMDTLAVFGSERGGKYVLPTDRYLTVATMHGIAKDALEKRGDVFDY